MDILIHNRACPLLEVCLTHPPPLFNPKYFKGKIQGLCVSAPVFPPLQLSARQRRMGGPQKGRTSGTASIRPHLQLDGDFWAHAAAVPRPDVPLPSPLAASVHSSEQKQPGLTWAIRDSRSFSNRLLRRARFL